MGSYEKINEPIAEEIFEPIEEKSKGVIWKISNFLKRAKYELSDSRVCEILQKCMDPNNDVILTLSARRD